MSWLKTSLSRDSDAAAAASSDTIVLVNGALVNVSSILDNLTRSADERAQTEKELKNLEEECGMYHFFQLTDITICVCCQSLLVVISSLHCVVMCLAVKHMPDDFGHCYFAVFLRLT